MANVGRPRKLTEELQIDLLAQISVGRSLNQICKEKRFPAATNVFKFIHKCDEFRQKYQEAVAMRAEWIDGELLEIADEGSGDTQRDKLRIDTRKWYLSKLNPRKYSDKLQLDAEVKSTRIVIGGDE